MEFREGDVLPATDDLIVKVYIGGFSEVAHLKSDISGTRAAKRLRDSVIKIGGPDIQQLFARECQIWLKELENAPHVAKAFFYLNMAPYGPLLFMEYIDGPSLRQMRQDLQHLSISQVVRVWHQIAQALAFAHGRKIQHRDLKPSNILINRQNQVKIIDWGLADVATVEGFPALSTRYSSPDHEANPRLNDPKEDIYATGIIIYECLTGSLPAQGSGTATLKHELERAQPLLPEALVKTLITMLDPNTPSNRPDAAELVALLGNPQMIKDIEKREIDRPFCPACHFVAWEKTMASCPLCKTSMRRRKARPEREGMLRISAGSFTHGLTEKQAQNALNAAHVPVNPQNMEMLITLPMQSIFLPDFDIDKFPVTNAQFDAFCQACNYPEPKDLAVNKTARPNHPVVNVDWKDALCYALWAGKRLPLSLEWEKAARGSEDTRSYPWEDIWQPNRCNHNQQPRTLETTPVTEFISGAQDGRSPFGVADMVGNVGEWQADGEQLGLRFIRGGGWNASCAVHGLITFGMQGAINVHDPATGFRCAADIVYDEIVIADGQKE